MGTPDDPTISASLAHELSKTLHLYAIGAGSLGSWPSSRAVMLSPIQNLTQDGDSRQEKCLLNVTVQQKR